MWGWEYIAVLRVMLMGVTKDPADNIKRKFFMAEDAETSAQSPLHEAGAVK